MTFPVTRMRRLRATPHLRNLVAESRLRVDDLVAPLFVREGMDEPRPVTSLPGVVQHTVDSVVKEARRLADLGVPGLVLFGVPVYKDDVGSGAWDPNGIVQVAARAVRHEVGEGLTLMADLCLDEYTDHGHCGPLDEHGSVDNDRTIELYGRVAVAQAEAGVEMVAPSGMMDGQVAAIRRALDDGGYPGVGIMAYSAKYASALYGPFREAVDVTIAGGGNRRGYQQDWRNRRESLREVALDIEEGADIVMVKPAGMYLDVIAAVRDRFDVPVAAYQVSGEYAMVKAAAERGWIDGDAIALESVSAIKRAGADIVLTYFAGDLAEVLGGETDRSASEVEPDRGNDELFERARRVTPGGVNSPVRAFRSVGGTPYFVARGSGSSVWDVEGRRYLDFVQSYGASILGHAHPAVVSAIQQAATQGTTFGAPTEREVLLAEEICRRVEGCDEVRLVNSGTEATMSAVRLARGATGRDRVVVFEGCYHGHSDGLLAAGGSGVATLGLPASAGVTRSAVADTVVVPYNQVPEIGDDVACVIVEPVAANMGLVPPVPGFLIGLRAACDRAGALLIFDEVITGFRVAHGSVASIFGVRPDLWCFGKVIGGGLPLAAFGGERTVMEQLAPSGPVYQAGTLSGNPLATAAGLCVLEQLTPDVYPTLAEAAGRFAADLTSVLSPVLSAAGVNVQVPVVGPLVGVFFTSEPVTSYQGAKASADTGIYPGFMHGLLDGGVAIAPGAYEVLFPSLAHSRADYDRATAAAGPAAAAAVAAVAAAAR